MEIKTIQKEVAAELIQSIAELEDFKKVLAEMRDEFSVVELRALLREVAVGLRLEAAEESPNASDMKKVKGLKRKSKEIISYLSPREESKLLKTFGLTD